MAASAGIRRAVANPATSYVLRAAGWFLFLLAALRISWVQTRLLIPFASLQGKAAAALLGEGQLRVVVDTSCTGSDALAVCLGAILAFPATWKRRLLAAAGGFLLISAVNTVRIGNLSQVSTNPELFRVLHHQIWPALIILVAAVYAFLWMRWVTAPAETGSGTKPSSVTAFPVWPALALATTFVAIYYVFYDQLLAASWLRSVAHLAATTAGWLMTTLGVSARVSGGVLQTTSGAWLVTPECVTTPLIPLYVTAVLMAPTSWRRRLPALVATPLLFVALGTARLMVLALPRVLVGSHGIAVHAFYQVLVAVVLIGWLARRGGRGRATRTTILAVGIGIATGALVGTIDFRALRPVLDRVADTVHLGHGYVDAQGVLTLLPGFQLGLLAAIWAACLGLGRTRQLLAAAALLAAAGAGSLVVLGELSVHAAIEAPLVLIRAWSIGVPPLIAWSLGWIRSRPRLASPAPGAPSPAA